MITDICERQRRLAIKMLRDCDYLRPIFKVDTRLPVCALTFDGESLNMAPEVCRVLREKDVRCTFFLTGKCVVKNPVNARMLIDEGHEIASHSYSHPCFSKISPVEQTAELSQCAEVFRRELGIETSLFRFPYGDCSPICVKHVKELGYIPVQWSLDTIDWEGGEAESLVERVSGRLRSGSIILCHVNGAHIVQALSGIIDNIRSAGLSNVKVSQLLYPKESSTVDMYGVQRSLERVGEGGGT